MKVWDNVGDSSCIPVPLPDRLCHVTFRRHLPLSLKVVEKPNKCKSFLAQFFSGGQPKLSYVRLLERFTVHRLAQFGRVPFADPPSAKPGNEEKCKFFGGWVK